MANYLAGIGTTAALSAVGGAAPIVGSSPQSSSGTPSGLVSALAFGGLGMGTKPKALHTEYATGEANWQKPYGSGTDIVFYLVRADAGQPGTDPNSSSGTTPNSPSRYQASTVGTQDTLDSNGDMTAGGAAFGSATQTGPGYPEEVQSPLNQVAAQSYMLDLAEAPQSPGLAGPLTGLSTVQEVQIGAFSQTFAQLSTTNASIRNLTGAVASSTALRLSAPSSEKYFSQVLQESFQPGSATDSVVRTADQIESSFNKGATSALATDLAIASGGVTTSKQLIEGINKGLIGFTTISGGAEANRLGPQGYSRERLAK